MSGADGSSAKYINAVACSHTGGLWGLSTHSGTYDQTATYYGMSIQDGTQFTIETDLELHYFHRGKTSQWGDSFIYDGEVPYIPWVDRIYSRRGDIVAYLNGASYVSGGYGTAFGEGATGSYAPSFKFPFTSINVSGGANGGFAPSGGVNRDATIQSTFTSGPTTGNGTSTANGGRGTHLTYNHYGWNNGAGEWQEDYYGTEPANINGGSMRAVRVGFEDGQPWRFNGESAYLKLNGSSRVKDYNIQTILFTISSDQIPDGNAKTILDTRDEDSGLALYWIHPTYPDKVAVYFQNHSSQELFDRPIDTNKHRIAIVYDAEALHLFIYFDGVLVHDSTDEVHNLSAYIDQILIGGDAFKSKPRFFEGNIENLQVFDYPIFQEDIDLDYAQFDGNPSWNFVSQNYTRDIQFKNHTKTWSNITNESPGVLTNYGHSAGRDTVWVIPYDIKDDGDYLEFKYEPSGNGNQVNYDNATFGLIDTTTVPHNTSGSASDQSEHSVDYGFYLNNDRTSARVIVKGSVRVSLGSYLDTDIWKIEYDNTDIVFYKNNVEVFRELNEIDISISPILRPGGMWSWTSSHGGEGRLTILDYTLHNISSSFKHDGVTPIEVNAHMLLTDGISEHGHKSNSCS